MEMLAPPESLSYIIRQNGYNCHSVSAALL